MAGMVLTFIDVAFNVGQLIAGIFADNEAEKEFRSGWTQEAASQLATDNPGKNIMVVYTEHDASGLVTVEKKALQCEIPGGAKLAYVVYIFDEGRFVLKGDGGFLNWCMMGTFDKQDKNVTFSRTPQAIQMEADKKKAEEDAAAAKKAEEDAAAAKKAEEDAAAAKKAQEDAEAAKKAQEDAEAAKKAQEDAEAPPRSDEEWVPPRNPGFGIPSVQQSLGYPYQGPANMSMWGEDPSTNEQGFDDPHFDTFAEENGPFDAEEDDPYDGEENGPYYGAGHRAYEGQENDGFEEEDFASLHPDDQDAFEDVEENYQQSGWEDADDLQNSNITVPFQQGPMDPYEQEPMRQGFRYAPRNEAYTYAY